MTAPIEPSREAMKIARDLNNGDYSMRRSAERIDTLIAAARRDALEEAALVDMTPNVGYVPWDIAVNVGLRFAARPLLPTAANEIHRYLVDAVSRRAASAAKADGGGK